ncbi:MAG: ABC transporter ATP-binding protein, partial [Methanobacteriota archaeon]
FSLSVHQGEIYGLLGPNGSGKTTALNILTNMLTPDAGEITLNGKAVGEVTKTDVGIAPQDNEVYINLTVQENLEFFSSIYGLTRKEIKKRMEELIQWFSFEEYRDTLAGTLSGGWLRRLNIAIALVHSPKILILDEPTVGLDLDSRYSLWELIRRLGQSGVTILLTTHYLEEAEQLCTRIGIMAGGKILREGTITELTALIPAKLLALVESPDELAIKERANELGWQYRHHGGRLVLWLPRIFELKEVVNVLDGIPLTSITLLPVRLEHVYAELVKDSKPEMTPQQ